MVGIDQTYRPGLFARLFNAGSWRLALSRKRSDTIKLEDGESVDLACMDVVAISFSKGLLWHSVEMRSRSRVVRVTGLPDLPYAAVLSELAVFNKYQEIATPDEVLFSGVEVQNV